MDQQDLPDAAANVRTVFNCYLLSPGRVTMPLRAPAAPPFGNAAFHPLLMNHVANDARGNRAGSRICARCAPRIAARHGSHDRVPHKRRHENERLFRRRLKGFSAPLLTLFEKFDVKCLSRSSLLAFIVDSFRR